MQCCGVESLSPKPVGRRSRQVPHGPRSPAVGRAEERHATRLRAGTERHDTRTRLALAPPAHTGYGSQHQASAPRRPQR